MDRGERIIGLVAFAIGAALLWYFLFCDVDLALAKGSVKL